jgi:glutaminyl-peptide cyclotransferase
MPKAILLFPILLLLGCTRERQQPAPVTQAGTETQGVMATTQPPEFLGTRAFTFLTRQTDFGPRDPNSAGHERCLQYLASTLGALSDQVRLQPFTHAGYDGRELHLTNVFASFRPEAAARILLCAHWDTRPRADQDEDRSKRNAPILGANDGASGVAVLLELATLMKTAPPAIGVDLLLVDGEDYGREGDQQNYLLGSKYFARTRPAGYLPRFGILLDMVGDTFLELPKEGNSLRYAPDVVALVWSTARALGIAQFVDAPGEEIMDDHLPLNEVGIKTIDIIDFNYPDQTNRYWHTHQDTPDHCSAESLGAVGTVLTHVIYGQRP